MKKLIILFFVLATIVACEKQEVSDMTPLDQSSMKGKPQLPKADLFCGFDLNEDYSINVYRTLFAGQTMDVGYVHIWNADGSLHVEYSLDGDPEGDHIFETHLYVGNYGDCPLNNPGNPKVGNFPYAGELTYEIPYEELNVDENGNFIVAAHAVVEPNIGFYEFETTIPEGAKWLSPKVNTGPTPKEAYFWYASLGTGDCNNFNPDDIWDGQYPGWCLNPLAHISPGACYETYLYSTYGYFPVGLLMYPENLDKVNWLINQDFVGQEYGDDEFYTYGDIQMLVWLNLNPGNLAPSQLGGLGGVGDYDQDHVDYLQGQMDLYGEGFVPACDELIGIILYPQPLEGNTAPVQPILVFVPYDCEWGGEETAWMQGNQYFPGKRWDWYQEFMPTCPN